MDRLLQAIDWFIPDAATLDRSELGLARNFVATHILGPLLSQSISVLLLMTDPEPGFAAWTMVTCVCLFWTLPFILKFSNSLPLSAIISVELLAFTSLFGAFHYGGVSSPFLPWLIVALMLGFFYLNRRPMLVIGMFAFNIAVFCAFYLAFNFSQRIPLQDLAMVGWISIFSATVYMSWMAVYYAHIMTMGSELEREAERHRATAVRLRNAKELADRASRLRSIFLAKMSHELRTPLNAVIGYSEILLESVEIDGKNPAKKVDLERINAAGKHLLSLVADVLDLSKIESNQIELKIERFSLDDLFASIVTTTQHLVEARNNRLVFVASGGESGARERLGEASTDPTKLRQIILNLVSNAAKFTQNGVITLSARRERRAGGDWIEVQVRDTGIGIARDELSRLFQNFVRPPPRPPASMAAPDSAWRSARNIAP
ncbi:MAG: hypothetical protein JNK46_03610 [Methylobacteriaceae bacterium]|nr:hypothetical protein [Methylobacteriaceae bacterium]